LESLGLAIAAKTQGTLDINIGSNTDSIVSEAIAMQTSNTVSGSCLAWELGVFANAKALRVFVSLVPDQPLSSTDPCKAGIY
jgi:hypothetical protein